MNLHHWVQRHMQENKDTNGLVVTVSFPQGVRYPFIWHQQIPSQKWGHFLPGKRYSPAFLNHQSGNLRDGCELPQLHTVEPDLWDPSLLCKPTQGCQKMWPFSGMLDGLVGSPKVRVIPHVLIHTKRLWSLPLWYRVWVEPGWQATQLLASN